MIKAWPLGNILISYLYNKMSLQEGNPPAGGRQVIKKEGRVTEALPNAFFKIVLNEDGKEIMGFLSGKMRMNKITILPGDKVLLEMTPYDDSKGRIVYRLK